MFVTFISGEFYTILEYGSGAEFTTNCKQLPICPRVIILPSYQHVSLNITHESSSKLISTLGGNKMIIYGLWRALLV